MVHKFLDKTDLSPIMFTFFFQNGTKYSLSRIQSLNDAIRRHTLVNIPSGYSLVPSGTNNLLLLGQVITNFCEIRIKIN